MPVNTKDTEALRIAAEKGAPEQDRVLTPAALSFIAKLCSQFEPRRQELLKRRHARQAELATGKLPDFLPETASIRQSDWKVAPIPADLRRRHVEITGPVDRKMIINALNCGADAFMADFEDSNSPTWDNCISGQANLVDAVRRTISLTTPEGKSYKLNDKTATLIVRPRGWHLNEKHVLISGRPISASLFDFGLFFFHNAQRLIENGSGPYFYLPKMESHLEARLWNDVFNWSQDQLRISRGTIRATVLIETILAAFEMDEILYELRDHSAGLNCGRWDYIFSLIKKLGMHPQFVLPDRALVTMTTPFMRAYSLLTIKTCHRRGIHAMGGMAAQIPIKNNPAASEAALGKVRDDKRREATDGHDGTWVAHPGLVPVAREQFDAVLKEDNQIARLREDVQVTAQQLLAVSPERQISEQGIRTNINVGIQYLESWLRGQGCVPINNLMEDAATVEISRTQLWQWVHHGSRMADGRVVALELVDQLLAEEMKSLRNELGAARFDAGKFAEAKDLFVRMTRSRECPEFLTSIAYELI
ncbi:MAG TPA: malate synthase A [Tepidisphaeraceae bacterium]|jgi:malate synthase